MFICISHNQRISHYSHQLCWRRAVAASLAGISPWWFFVFYFFRKTTHSRSLCTRAQRESHLNFIISVLQSARRQGNCTKWEYFYKNKIARAKRVCEFFLSLLQALARYRQWKVSAVDDDEWEVLWDVCSFEIDNGVVLHHFMISSFLSAPVRPTDGNFKMLRQQLLGLCAKLRITQNVCGKRESKHVTDIDRM